MRCLPRTQCLPSHTTTRDGAAPPRLSHRTAPPDPRQPHPTTRSLTAQPHPIPLRIATPPRFGQKRWQKFQLSFFTRKMNILAQFKKSPIITFSARVRRPRAAGASSHTVTRGPQPGGRGGGGVRNHGPRGLSGPAGGQENFEIALLCCILSMNLGSGHGWDSGRGLG